MNEESETGPRAERGLKRVRAFLAGELVVDTRTPVLVWEWPFYPAYYLPRDDVTAALEPAADDRLDVCTAHGVAEKAARRTVVTVDGEDLDLVRVDWAAMDEWFEEDEPVYVHPRDPGVRVDVLASSRHVVMEVDGHRLVESRQPRILLETRLPPRYYVPITDVRMELLRPSSTISHCPYKGTASYWSVVLDGTVHEDLVWTYRSPLPESQKVMGLASVYTEKVDLWLDGVLQDRPRMHFV